ncbi:Uncharacterized protein Rs2_05861 [Raphanus sativus]|nr:Uncharacterized protein Rs2_05861 [Raphanus sativus]
MTQRLEFKPGLSLWRTSILTELNPRPPLEPPDPPYRTPPPQSKSPSTAAPPLLTHLELAVKVLEISLLQRHGPTHHETEQPSSPQFVELHQPDLRLSHPCGCMLSLRVSVPHRKGVCPIRAPPPAIGARESDYRLGRYLPNSAIRALFVVLLDIGVDASVLLSMLVGLKPPSLQYTALRSLEDWTFDVDTLLCSIIIARMLSTI